MSPKRLASCAALSIVVSAAAALPALAATDVSVVPPAGARFLAGQKFDLRVEGKGTGPYSATLAIDGTPRRSRPAPRDRRPDGITTAG